MESNSPVKQSNDIVFVDLIRDSGECIIMEYSFINEYEKHSVKCVSWEDVLFQMDLRGIGKGDMALITSYFRNHFHPAFTEQYLYSEFKKAVERRGLGPV